ncbi:MAG: xanthine dehydrogenase family protein subunit M, partial [Anaerolineales bacterium]|nr:xanthine dehydrogenase family protein subunit M [Anaerolineales bacterium]
TWTSYHLPHTLTEAFAILKNEPQSKVIAGGTDLLLELQQGRHAPIHTLVDLSAIPELQKLEQMEKMLWIGAAVPLNRLIGWQPTQQYATALHEAAALIGGPQLRNVATLGGNVAHALPAADGAIALLALDAQVVIATPEGQHTQPLLACYAGPGKTALDRTEIIVAFQVPISRPDEASAFRRVMRPQGVAIAIQNMGVWLRREGDRIGDLRIAVGPAGPVPFRAQQTEATLRGKRLSEEILTEAEKALQAEARFRSSPHRATAEYRYHLAGILLRQTLQTAWQRAYMHVERESLSLSVKG